MTGPRGVTNDDAEVGVRLRWARKALGATRREFGEVLGVSAQQVLKYEVGQSRISAGQLVVVARAFKIPVGRLFGDTGVAGSDSQNETATQLMRDFVTLDADLQGEVARLARTLASRKTSSKQP